MILRSAKTPMYDDQEDTVVGEDRLEILVVNDPTLASGDTFRQHLIDHNGNLGSGDVEVLYTTRVPSGLSCPYCSRNEPASKPGSVFLEVSSALPS